MANAEKLAPAGDAKVGYNFAFTGDLGSGKMIQITGVFPVSASGELMNAEFDKIRKVLNRQLANTILPAIEEEIEGIDRTLSGLKKDLADAEDRFKDKRLPDNEKQVQHNIGVSLRNLEEKRKDKVKFLEKTRKEAE